MDYSGPCGPDGLEQPMGQSEGLPPEKREERFGGSCQPVQET